MRLASISTLSETLSIDPDFVGRDDVLRKMDEELNETGRVALVSLGGIGYEVADASSSLGLTEDRKTEIAMQYSHKYREKNPDCHIFWVYESISRSFDDAYKRLAKELEIPECDDSLFDHRKMVLKELEREQTGSWIMIVDNANDYYIYFAPPTEALIESEKSNYIAHCLPNSAICAGRLIITTRSTQVGKDLLTESTSIQVLNLSPLDAKQLLRNKVPPEKWK